MLHLDNPQDLIKIVFSSLVHFGVPVLISNTLVKTLALVNPKNRSVSNWIIWLNVLLEPIVSFFIVRGASTSISKELKDRHFEDEKNPAFFPGITYAILALSVYIGFFLVFNNLVPVYAGQIVALLYFSKVFFMVKFWSKITWYKRILEEDKPVDEQEEVES
jgi:hypothetical protein